MVSKEMIQNRLFNHPNANAAILYNYTLKVCIFGLRLESNE